MPQTPRKPVRRATSRTSSEPSETTAKVGTKGPAKKSTKDLAKTTSKAAPKAGSRSASQTTGKPAATKSTARKPASKASARVTAAPFEGPAVHVRMYRGILGDCFLLTLKVDGTAKYILIDCGVLQNVPSGEELWKNLPQDVQASLDKAEVEKVEAGPDQIRRIAEDVAETTDNHLDLVIITHEHFDHLSGFAYGRDVFEKMAIDQLWMAWTENPDDPQANKLKARFTKVKQALALAMEAGSAMGVGDERLAVVRDLSSFLGVAKVGGAIRSTQDMMDFIRKKAGPEATRYLSPGEVLDMHSDLGLKAYVLGPPRDEVKLAKDSPSGGARKEVYLTALDDVRALDSAIRSALPADRVQRVSATAKSSLGLGEKVEEEDTSDAPPFARPHLHGLEVTPPNDLRAPLSELYGKDKYRQIENEWQGAAEALALKLDSDTNNTSLALALELPDGQVLLFPGDAQVGNWLSWHDQTYPPKPRQDQEAVSMEDLLKRVVFYKVGHHCSHNATLKALGLEKMTNSRLTAAVPLVEAVAKVQGKGRKKPGAGWAMPYPSLYADLQTRTRGRIIRGDGDPKQEQDAFNHAGGRKPITVAHGENGLWAELIIPLDP